MFMDRSLLFCQRRQFQNGRLVGILEFGSVEAPNRIIISSGFYNCDYLTPFLATFIEEALFTR